MVQVTHYDFSSLWRMGRRVFAAAQSEAEKPRLVLQASFSNIHWIFIGVAVTALVLLPSGLFRLWQEGGREGVLIFGALASTILTLCIIYNERKARWIVAAPSGVTVTERTTIRKYAWPEVGEVQDLGYWGGAPAAKRCHIEFSDGRFFTFLGDPAALAQLEKLRPIWEKS